MAPEGVETRHAFVESPEAHLQRPEDLCDHGDDVADDTQHDDGDNDDRDVSRRLERRCRRGRVDCFRDGQGPGGGRSGRVADSRAAAVGARVAAEVDGAIGGRLAKGVDDAAVEDHEDAHRHDVLNDEEEDNTVDDGVDLVVEDGARSKTVRSVWVVSKT